jgi:hypothetical protein
VKSIFVDMRLTTGLLVRQAVAESVPPVKNSQNIRYHVHLICLQ